MKLFPTRSGKTSSWTYTQHNLRRRSSDTCHKRRPHKVISKMETNPQNTQGEGGTGRMGEKGLGAGKLIKGLPKDIGMVSVPQK